MALFLHIFPTGLLLKTDANAKLIKRKFRFFPVLVLEVDPVALGYLLASSAVSAVNPDTIAHAMPKGAEGILQETHGIKDVR